MAHPLRERNFRILFAGRVVDGFGDAVSPAALTLAVVAGPAIAGALIFTVGAGWAFVLDAATFAVSAGTLALIRVRPMDVPRQSLRRELVAGWAEVRARTWYWASIIGHGTCNFALGMLMTTGPLIAITELGGPSTSC